MRVYDGFPLGCLECGSRIFHRSGVDSDGPWTCSSCHPWPDVDHADEGLASQAADAAIDFDADAAAAFLAAIGQAGESEPTPAATDHRPARRVRIDP